MLNDTQRKVRGNGDASAAIDAVSVTKIFGSGKDKVLARTEEIPDTYWLMETLLNNMEQEFATNC